MGRRGTRTSGTTWQRHLRRPSFCRAHLSRAVGSRADERDDAVGIGLPVRLLLDRTLSALYCMQ